MNVSYNMRCKRTTKEKTELSAIRNIIVLSDCLLSVNPIIICTLICLFPYILLSINYRRLRPYRAENTPSRPIWQVKQRWARLVLGSETSWESRVLQAFVLLVFGCFLFG